jgi:putative redox protein
MGTVIVRGGATGFVQEVTVDRHRLLADEPEAAGGSDAGPSPYDYLLVALGS